MVDAYEVVTLIGPINPVGSTDVDNDRYENLKALTELVDKLVDDIIAVAMHNGSTAYSVKKAAEFAAAFLTKGLGIREV